MNEQQVFNAVMIAADCRERLARTWEAAAERYFRLADSLPLCSFDRAKAAAHATDCQAFADQLGGLDYVAREVVNAPEIIDYTRRENVAERLARQFGAAVGAGVVRALGASGFKLN